VVVGTLYVTHTGHCGDDGVQQLDDTIFSSHQRERFITESVKEGFAVVLSRPWFVS
jgi:hypothetical protein